MKKNLKVLLGLIIVTIMILPFSITNAAEEQNTKTVTSESELLEALADISIDTIVIGQDITTTAQINITRPVTIDGNSKTITYKMEDNSVWKEGQAYVLQAYKTDVTIKDITLTGANAALLVNGANVTLVELIDVSGNGFGGIELATKDGIAPTIDLSAGGIMNTTEEYLKPTVWTDPINDENIKIDYPFEYNKEITKANGKKQRQYYLFQHSIPVDEQLNDQKNSDFIFIRTHSSNSVDGEFLESLKGQDKVIDILT